MILDTIDRHARYQPLGRGIAAALLFLRQNDLQELVPGRLDIDGDRLYALVQEYVTKPAAQGSWEAHRRYIDLHYLVRGGERIRFAPIEHLQQGAYQEEKDFLPLTGEGSAIDLLPGCFVILYPEDAHMPGLAIDAQQPVRKVVLKIKIV